MQKSKQDIITEGLNGRIIDDFLDGWAFQVQEVSSNVYRVDGKDKEGHTTLGAGVDPIKAFDDCVMRAKRIIVIQRKLSQIKEFINRLFNIRK